MLIRHGMLSPRLFLQGAHVSLLFTRPAVCFADLAADISFVLLWLLSVCMQAGSQGSTRIRAIQLAGCS